MTATREQAWAQALTRTKNAIGTCQLVTRGYFGAASAGDRDHDGDYDAVDGWASEPVSARHTGADARKPPLGTPVSWSGGSHGYGHRAISGGPDHNGVYQIRSTDAPSAGITSTVPLSWIEERWGLHYLGWSETIDGEPISYNVPRTSPDEVPSRVTPPKHDLVPRAQRLTERAAIRAEARGQRARAKSLRAALALLRKSTTQKKG